MSRLCLILFGPPGSGKGTQAKLLKQFLGVAHISTGDMLRAHVEAGDALGLEVTAVMQSGGLVPDETVERMVEERIEQPDCEKGFILDGFPRTVRQARLLSGLLNAKHIRPKVVYLKVDYNIIIARISSRRQCPNCGALYGLTANAQISTVCDYDGSKLVIRSDDRPEVVTERLRAYDMQTAPVLEYLKSQGDTFWELDGADGSPQTIARRVQALIEGEDQAGNAKV